MAVVDGSDRTRIDETLTSALQLIAEGVQEFAGFDVAAVSLVTDGVLHTVAVVGDDDAVAQLLDLQAPVDLVERELVPAEVWGSLRFLPAELASGHLADLEWVPDIATPESPDAWRPEDLLCGLLHDRDGRLRGVLSVDLPVSRRRPDLAQRTTLQMYVRLAERALVTALERGDLVQRVEREHAIAEYRQTIIDALSHELQGTAAAISNTVEVLGCQIAPDAPLQAALKVINGGAERIRTVVDDMSALAKFGVAGDVALRTLPTALGAIARDSIRFHSASAALHRVSLSLEVVGPAVVLGDPEDLDRMVGNLLSNAIKYSNSGGEVRVAVGTLSDGEGADVVLTVADNGIGIGANDRERIFEEFFRSHRIEVRRRPGTGLGLAIVDRIVRLHGGSMRVDSVLGKGATFTVVLPGHAAGDAAGDE